jgi:hypothetical protein
MSPTATIEMEARMYRDFYATLAQVLPVLLLALIWESRYLERLSGQARPSRRTDPANGFWWTKRRVRIYALTIASVIVGELAIVLLVLAGLFGDSTVLRAILVVGVSGALASLLFRIVMDVVVATKE